MCMAETSSPTFRLASNFAFDAVLHQAGDREEVPVTEGGSTPFKWQRCEEEALSGHVDKRDEQPAPWYDEAPKSVNWVLQSFDEPHVWKAYIDGREVSASVARGEASQGWEAFTSFLKLNQDSGCDVLISCNRRAKSRQCTTFRNFRKYSQCWN